MGATLPQRSAGGEPGGPGARRLVGVRALEAVLQDRAGLGVDADLVGRTRGALHVERVAKAAAAALSLELFVCDHPRLSLDRRAAGLSEGNLGLRSVPVAGERRRVRARRHGIGRREPGRAEGCKGDEGVADVTHTRLLCFPPACWPPACWVVADPGWARDGADLTVSQPRGVAADLKPRRDRAR